MTSKEQLSEYVENIFKQYTQPGLHICDLATGNGKTYTISKLACQYYPKHFGRIIILCVQNKLIDSMRNEINKFIGKKGSLLQPSDMIILHNNTDTIKGATKNGSLMHLKDDIEQVIKKQKDKLGENTCSNISYSAQRIKNYIQSVEHCVNISKDNRDVEELTTAERKLRKELKYFFKAFKHHLQQTKQRQKVDKEYILKTFPNLVEVYPQIRCEEKKLWITTIQKAMYGIDPILTDRILLDDFVSKKRKTLILFDESDQAAIAMRNVIVEQSTDDDTNYDKEKQKYAKGYHNFLQYKKLIDEINDNEALSDAPYGKLLKDGLQKAQIIVKQNWQKLFKGSVPFCKNIFLEDNADYNTFRRGIFLSGPVFRLNIGSDQEEKAYICFKKGEKHFRLVHNSSNEKQLLKEYNEVVSLDWFLRSINQSLKGIKQQLLHIATKPTNNDDYYTLEDEIHTLLSRFESSSEKLFELQLYDFRTNRKNLQIKKGNGTTISLPDYSVYFSGIQLYQEEIDEQDMRHRIRLPCYEITNTPEKMLYNLVINGSTSVVLCSATAGNRTVIGNFDIDYLQSVLHGNISFLSQEQIKELDNLIERTLPAEHNCQVDSIKQHEYEDKRKEKISLPEKYEQCFCKEAKEDGTVDSWFSAIRNKFYDDYSDNNNTASFYLCRIYPFVEAYHFFIKHNDIHSMLYFQNRRPDKDLMTVTACLIDGTYKQYFRDGDLVTDIPTDWENKKLCFAKEHTEINEALSSSLSKEKNAKLMLITAYGSLKVGVNLQYEIPKGLHYLTGDNWETSLPQQKDWDAIYLENPTNYLTCNRDETHSYEYALLKLALQLMMLYERGWLSEQEVQKKLTEAIINPKRQSFAEEHAATDKAAWLQTILEQTVGRICRTKNKPKTTYLLYDESICRFFSHPNLNKSLTKEFRRLAEHIISKRAELQIEDALMPKYKCSNDEKRVCKLLKYIRHTALRYTPHPKKYDTDFEDETEEDNTVPVNVKNAQKIIQQFKQTIIQKPVIDSFDELNANDRLLFPSIEACYREYDSSSVSPSDVRLDILMKNKVIKTHFEKNGYATDWKRGKYVLHPQILRADYAGEIGEEAFKAIILEYINITEERFRHLEGKDYELADFVITNPDGSYKVAFDVKNLNPNIPHNDKDGDLSTNEKRKKKTERLRCPIITVNMLQMQSNSIDRSEICGIINTDGQVLQNAISKLTNLIEK